MKTWYMTEENELQLQYGQLRVVQDIEALRVRIDAALQVVKGELDDPTKGVDYFGIIFSATPISMKVQELSRVILNQDGVENVIFERVEHNKITQSLHFYFTVESVYGTFVYDREIEKLS